MMQYFRRSLNPAWYHGRGKKPPFFEGWYFKVINATEDRRFAFIPGIFINRDDSRTHSFIQVLNGMTGETRYHSYPVQAFRPAAEDFDIRVADSRFRADAIALDIDDEQGTIEGELRFVGLKPWPVSATSPGYMGPFGWLPFMECNHGILSFDHRIEGELIIDGETIDFTGGRGYIEKDWGKSFPEGYIWMQSNHFDEPEVSLAASIAVIPNFGIRWPGFTVGFWHEGILYRFASYNSTKVARLTVDDQHVNWSLYNANYELNILAERAAGGLLKGPEREDMHKRVDETMKASVEVMLDRLDGTRKHRIFAGKGRNMALEVVGNLSMLLKP